MDLFGDWIATKRGMLETLLAMVETGEIAHAETRDELLAAIGEMLRAGRASGDLRDDVSADDVAAALIGIFTVAGPGRDALARRLLDLLLHGMRAGAHVRHNDMA
jgi:hypothetical protein